MPKPQKMALFSFTFVALFGCGAARVTNLSFVDDGQYGVNADWRVVGGSAAATGQFPYMVSLRRATTDFHLCGGTIVSSLYIICAAHCTSTDSPSTFVAVVGTNTLDSGGTRYAISRFINHPDFNITTVQNDISLVRTSSNIVGSALVASIPISASFVGGGVSAVLSGWGTVSNGGMIPNELQFLPLKTLTNADCAAVQTGYPLFDSQICTFTQAGQGACHGDSGGPLVVNNVLVGIVSWGTPCGVGFPDVFTRVSSFVSWIQENAT